MTSPALPDGSQLAAMAIDNGTTIKTLKFYYDAAGIPMCLDYNGTIYFYITNLQGDVVALADQYGEVIRYEYDAWGVYELVTIGSTSTLETVWQKCTA